MISLHTPDDPAEPIEYAGRRLRRELITTVISLALAGGIGLTVLHGPRTHHRAVAPAHAAPTAVAASTFTVDTPAPAAASALPALPAPAGWAQAPTGAALPALVRRALAQIDTSSVVPPVVIYVVSTRTEADELETGPTVVNAIRATGGAPALYPVVVVNGPDASATIDAVLGHWTPAQIVDLR